MFHIWEKLTVKGTDSLRFLQKMMTNDISKIKNGAAQYNVMCYENGGTVDDLLIYKLKEDDYLLVVNAANTEKDYSWLKEHLEGDVSWRIFLTASPACICRDRWLKLFLQSSCQALH